MGDKIFFVYIITNIHMTTFYTGVTNNILGRVDEHKRGEGGVFSKKYHLTKLAYYELYQDIKIAIAREKQIKAGSRSSKVALINGMNPKWLDLSSELEQ
jgi:putative endonuclease